MNYPKIEINQGNDVVRIESSKVATEKELRDIVKGVDVRRFGSFTKQAIFLAHKNDLCKYDFYLTVDEFGFLVLVLAKK